MKTKSSSLTIAFALCLALLGSGNVQAASTPKGLTPESKVIATALAAIADEKNEKTDASLASKKSVDSKKKSQLYAIEIIMIPGAVISIEEGKITLEYTELKIEEKDILHISQSEVDAFNENLDVIQGMQDKLEHLDSPSVIEAEWKEFYSKKLSLHAAQAHKKIIRYLAKKLG